MFVTSDIFDLEQVASNWGVAGWRERLVGGIAIHGTDWPGGKAAARFLIEAAKVCDLQDQLPAAGYSIQWGEPSEHLDFAGLADLARGALSDGSAATSVYLEGSQGSVNTYDYVRYGGWLDAAPRMVAAPGNAIVPNYPFRAFDGDFGFPLDGVGVERAEALLRLAAEVLEADYGYFFVRDVLAGANFYARAQPAKSLGSDRLARADALESTLWRKFVGEGELWTGPWPQLRDIFAVNLLSTRHMTDYIEPIGYLHEWITAEPGRGRLKYAAEGRVLWTLTDAEIHAVRPAMWDSVSMRSCMPRVYRDLPYARQRPDPETARHVNDRISGT
jgi:hypothetical protein